MDCLYLWCLTEPRRPLLVGELHPAQGTSGVSLRYAPSWRREGWPLGEDLPLQEGEFAPTGVDAAPGAVNDSRPGLWGEQLIRLFDRPTRLSPLDLLYLAGDGRFGALGVSQSAQTYRPRPFGTLPGMADVNQLAEWLRRVETDEPVKRESSPWLPAWVALGGARPKALLEVAGDPAVVKFAHRDPANVPLIEHASLTLAQKAEIRVATSMAVPLMRGGHALVVRRFERTRERRWHALSARTALRASGEELGYPELAQFLRRKGVVAGERYIGQMRELYRRMVFNILIDNTEDDADAYSLLVTEAQQYELSPAYAVRPSGRASGFQRMRVGEQGTESTLVNALSMAPMFALRKDDAIREARTVARVIDAWKEHFRACGVTEADIDMYAAQIDRPFLLEQRRDLKRVKLR